MKSEELFRLGYEAAVEFMKAYDDGDTVVTEALVEAIEENKEGAYQGFKTTEPGRTLVLEAETREADRVNSVKWRSFRAGHRAACGSAVNIFFAGGGALGTRLDVFLQEQEARNLAEFQAGEK